MNKKDERNGQRNRGRNGAPLFQHRHFAVIAAVIADMPKHAASLRAQRESCANAFADRLAATNPNFDRSRFIAACKLEG